MRVKQPDQVVLTCQISAGFPPASIQWYRNSKYLKMFREISTDDKHEIATQKDVTSLIIAVSEPSHSATYRCEAVNKFGRVRTECSVVVVPGINLSATQLVN